MFNPSCKRMLVSFNFENRMINVSLHDTKDSAQKLYQTLFDECIGRYKNHPTKYTYIVDKKNYFIFYRNNRISKVVYYLKPSKFHMPYGCPYNKTDVMVALLYLNLCYSPEMHPFQADRDCFSLKELYFKYGVDYINFTIGSALVNCRPTYVNYAV